MEEPECSKENCGKTEMRNAGKSKDRPTKEKVMKDQKKVVVSEDETKEEISSSEESTSDEDEIRRREVKKSRSKRSRKKPEVLTYHRMGSPGQVNRVHTSHSIQDDKKELRQNLSFYYKSLK